MKWLLVATLCATAYPLLDGCARLDPRRGIKYRLIKSDARSAKAISTRRRVASLNKCRDFAESKHALAFNYEKNEKWEANCILLHCPETTGHRQLVNVTGVDYYSSYPSNMSTANARLTCLEDVGLFTIVKEQQNFTNAQAACQKIHGFLADVTSEARSRGLGLLIGELSAFVGLNNDGRERIWKNPHGDALSCFEYRAWGTGEPSHSRGCVTLFQVSPKTDPIWRVVPCSSELPFICEIPRSHNKTRKFKIIPFLT